jgi:hypothetical protein
MIMYPRYLHPAAEIVPRHGSLRVFSLITCIASHSLHNLDLKPCLIILVVLSNTTIVFSLQSIASSLLSPLLLSLPPQS